MVYVTGHSGAGKTTLLKLLGLIALRGEITVNGCTRAFASVRFPRCRGIGMVFQNHRLLMEIAAFGQRTCR